MLKENLWIKEEKAMSGKEKYVFWFVIGQLNPLLEFVLSSKYPVCSRVVRIAGNYA
jgi:hypothetical protein